MRDLFRFWNQQGPPGTPPADPMANIFPMIAGAAVLGALSAVGMRQAQRPDHFILRSAMDGALAGAAMAAVGAFAMIEAPQQAAMLPMIFHGQVSEMAVEQTPPAVRPPGPKDWSPRTGICCCRKGKPCP